MFQQKAEDRLRSWREFRHSLESLSLEHALVQTAEFWTRAPFVPYNLDASVPNSWPDPWTLIDENVYCDVAKCLGIVYTVLLTEHKTNLDFELRVYEDPKTKYEYNLAWFNQGKYILNMIDGAVVNIEQFDKTLKLKHSYTAVDLQLENYI
jgi:hypothetical protein